MNSRWTTHPIERNGQIVSTRLNVEGDIAILKTLGTYGLLTANDIAAHNGRSYAAVIGRLNKLKRKPIQLVRVCDTQIENPRHWQYCRQVFQLSVAGIGKLLEAGFEPKKPKPFKHFLHSVTEAQTAASFQIGARKCGLKHVSLGRDPILFGEHRIVPDGGPIGLGYPGDLYRFVLFETDCASEPLTSSNKARQAIEAKFRGYLAFLESGYYETRWCIPNCHILFTTTTELRLKNMMTLLASLNPRAEFLRCFGFQKFETILGTQSEQGWAVGKEWDRVGTPLDLSKP